MVYCQTTRSLGREPEASHMGRGEVPEADLRPSRVGFDSPALHQQYSLLASILPVVEGVIAMSTGERKKTRSPSYPAIDLEQAVERARALLERENRHWVPVDTALEAWGYRPASGLGLLILAALKKYGLLEDQGTGTDRKVRLTDQAYEIVIDEREDSPERATLLREAALRPRIHAELWNRYSAKLPSDGTIRFELRRKGFSEDGSQKLIAEWRRTFDYAGLSIDSEESVPVSPEVKVEEAEATVPSPPSVPGAPLTSHVVQSGADQPVQLPLSQNRWATLIAPFPLVESEWEQMVAVLKAMKPALTTGTTRDSEDL